MSSRGCNIRAEVKHGSSEGQSGSAQPIYAVYSRKNVIDLLRYVDEHYPAFTNHGDASVFYMAPEIGLGAGWDWRLYHYGYTVKERDTYIGIGATGHYNASNGNISVTHDTEKKKRREETYTVGQVCTFIRHDVFETIESSRVGNAGRTEAAEMNQW